MAKEHPDIVLHPIRVNNTSGIIDILRRGAVNPDLVLIADCPRFEKAVIPAYADWYIRYGNCDMVLSYTNFSPYAGLLANDTWYTLLAEKNATIGMLNPGATDARGWRSLISLDLADTYYNQSVFDRFILPESGISRSQTSAGTDIHASAVQDTHRLVFYDNPADLAQAVKNGSVDIGWDYRGAAHIAGLSYLDLPSEINLGDAAFVNQYANTTVQTIRGEKRSSPVVFGVTIPKIADNQPDAQRYISMMLCPEGRQVLLDHGQFPIIPPDLVSCNQSWAPDIYPGMAYSQISVSACPPAAPSPR